MRFTNGVALLATLAFSVSALSATKGASEAQVILIPSGNVTVQAGELGSAPTQPTAQQLPTTVVEAQPVTESRADSLRKARQSQEIQTEQKIVEKLEESRLKEEQQRAERLFGNKVDGEAKGAPSQEPVMVVPVKTSPPQESTPTEVKAQQVTIEKIEIIQPAPEKAKAEEAPAAAPVAESVAEAPAEPAEAPKRKIYVGGILGIPAYAASNLKTNYGLGFNVGTALDSDWSVEGAFVFSNHNVDTFWDYNIFRELDQYDIQAVGKYNFMTGPLKPYAGGGISYVYRKYTDRLKDSRIFQQYTTPESIDTHTFNLVVVAGADYEITERFSVGGGLDYNHPLLIQNKPQFSDWGLPANTRPVEEFDYFTFKLIGKMSF